MIKTINLVNLKYFLNFEIFLAVFDGLQCESRNLMKWQGGRANVGVSATKAYFEVLLLEDGLCRVGWSSLEGTLDLGILCLFMGLLFYLLLLQSHLTLINTKPNKS